MGEMGQNVCLGLTQAWSDGECLSKDCRWIFKHFRATNERRWGQLALEQPTTRTRVVTTPTKDGRRITMAEIAVAADVSVPTVSKVLNGRLDVAADTRRRVEEILESSGYLRGRRQRERDPWLIDLVFSEFGPYATEIIKAAEEAALQHGCRITVSALNDDPKETRWLDNIGPGRSDGVILVFAGLTPTHRDRLELLGVPVVIVDPLNHPDPQTPSVGVANWAGGLMATEHLVKLGHTRIGIIAGRMEMLCNQARLDGYRAALDRAGIKVDPA
ncbi:MAG: LacI family DNA-binding transcriptional regulator, partial [Hyphomicrobiales bacterium]